MRGKEFRDSWALFTRVLLRLFLEEGMEPFLDPIVSLTCKLNDLYISEL